MRYIHTKRIQINICDSYPESLQGAKSEAEIVLQHFSPASHINLHDHGSWLNPQHQAQSVDLWSSFDPLGRAAPMGSRCF